MYYEAWFELHESPFSISPDPRYLYLTQNHREALAHLLYGVSSNGGFVLLTGEIGAGKTTVCRCLLDQLPEKCDVAYVLNSKLSVEDFLTAVCDELAIPYSKEGGLKQKIDCIHRYLLDAHSRGRNTVLMVDEAQNLDTEVIEHLRLLTNLETAEKKLLQIILVGQPELRDKLALPDMKPMAQRITARFHLGALGRGEIKSYVHHRLQVAGVKQELFTSPCYKKLWLYSGGVPRLINTICDRALLGASVSKRKTVDGNILDNAAAEVLGRSAVGTDNYRWAWSVAAAVLMVGAFAATYYYQADNGQSHVQLIAAANKLPELPNKQIPAEQKPSPSTKTVAELQGMGEESVVEEKSPDSVVKPQQPVMTVQRTEPQIAGAEATLQIPQTLDREMMKKQAENALLTRWNIDDRDTGSVLPLCDLAENKGLACLQQQGTVESLRVVNRPALLTLYADDGTAVPAALIAMDAASAVLVVGDKRQQVAMEELRRWWYGQYLVLWQPPPGYRTPLRQGAQGEPVRWLLEQLQAPGDIPVYDGAVAGLVKWFQLENSLIPDGVVGPRTLIALNNSNGANVPRLHSGQTRE